MARFALLLGLLLSAPALAQDRLAPGDHERELRHGDHDRFYLIHVPPQAAEPKARLPVVLCYHGGGGAPAGMQEMAGLDEVADREGFVVVYPAGTGRLQRRLLTWNAGTCCGYAQREGIDDVAFTWAALADLATVLPLDPTRVYASGLSNGGMMSYKLAVASPDRVAAIVPVAGAQVCRGPEPGTRPVPLMHIHSVDDPRALYTGGVGPPFPFTNNRVEHTPVRDVIERWLAHNGCPPGARERETVEAPADSEDAGHSGVKIVYGPGREGVEVVLWRLRGVGHVWPGADRYAPARMVGEASSVILAAEELWSFCQGYQRPEAPALE